MRSPCSPNRLPAAWTGWCLLAGGLTVALVAGTGGGARGATPVSTAVTVTVRAGNSGATAGSARLVRSTTGTRAEQLQVDLVVTRPGGGNGSHLCLSTAPWQRKANFADCAYSDPAMHQASFRYSVNLGSSWWGKVIDVQLQTRVAKIGNVGHTENAYAGWQAHGATQDGDQYGQVALAPPPPGPGLKTAPPPSTRAAGGTVPTALPSARPEPPAATLAPAAAPAVEAAAAPPPVAAPIAAPVAAPVPAASSQLPFTGPAIPVQTLVLLALALLLAGAALLLAATSPDEGQW